MMTSSKADQVKDNRNTALDVAHRVILSLVGSYLFSWSFAAFGIATLVALGGDFHEAETALMLLSFLVFVPLFLWAFASRQLLKVWFVLGGGAGLMMMSAWAMQNTMI